MNKKENKENQFEYLANGVPTTIYNGLTGEDVSNLEFNHIANKLCFQYGKRKKEQ